MIIEPRVHIPKKIKAGDVILIQAALSHPMHRPPDGAKADEKDDDDANYIEIFAATFEGNTFFRTRFWSAISAHPYLAFRFQVPGPGTLQLRWTDNKDRSWSLSHKLKVA
ncbi:MAG: thiosulfate oxidation carrier complex protein SoxZ [Methyloligellaceae bacterium]